MEINKIEMKSVQKNWELVDMHLWVYWKLPNEETSKNYNNSKELAQLYRDSMKDWKKVVENFSWDNKKAFHLFYQAGEIINDRY